jgi:MFS family permease
MTSAADALPPRPAGADDYRVIGLIGGAHFTSHFFQLSLPPLFPVMREVFGVGYGELGLLMAVFYGVSSVGQAAAGFVVDRVGARAVLVGGTVLLGLSLILISQAASYPMLMLLVVPLALGNCVFHPADYSILSASVSQPRMGRGFSAHALGGTLGYAAAPVAMLGLSALGGWRFALAAVGCAGLAVALLIYSQSAVLREDRAASPHAGSDQSAMAAAMLPVLRLFASLPILLCFAYFFFLAMAGTALQSFLPPTMLALHGIPITAGASALTAYLFGSATGITLGGYTADKMRHHEFLVGLGLCGAASMVLLAGFTAGSAVTLTAMMATAGFCAGTASAARDMLVRRATPKGASGKVFGFVYSGLDFGSTVSPAVAGYLLDHELALAVIFLVASGHLLAVSTALGLGRQARAPQPVPAE